MLRSCFVNLPRLLPIRPSTPPPLHPRRLTLASHTRTPVSFLPRYLFQSSHRSPGNDLPFLWVSSLPQAPRLLFFLSSLSLLSTFPPIVMSSPLSSLQLLPKWHSTRSTARYHLVSARPRRGRGSERELPRRRQPQRSPRPLFRRGSAPILFSSSLGQCSLVQLTPRPGGPHPLRSPSPPHFVRPPAPTSRSSDRSRSLSRRQSLLPSAPDIDTWRSSSAHRAPRPVPSAPTRFRRASTFRPGLTPAPVWRSLASPPSSQSRSRPRPTRKRRREHPGLEF